MEDKQIIKLFFARADEAIQALRVRFGNTLYKIAMNILGNHHDAEETTNDTYLAIWNAIPPKEPDPLAPYVYRTGRNMALKQLEYLSAEKRNNSYDSSFGYHQHPLLHRYWEYIQQKQFYQQFLNNYSYEYFLVLLVRGLPKKRNYHTNSRSENAMEMTAPAIRR